MYRIFADNQLLYDPNFEEYLLESPRFKVEANTCGEASFNIFPTHPLYSSLQKLRTVIQIEEEGEVVFRGRIIDDGKDINTIKNIDCEGVLAYMNDSVVPPFVFPDNFNTSGSDNVIKFFLNWLIENHNAQVEDFQKFKLGIVTVKDSNNYIYRSSEEHKNTWEIMSEKLFNSTLGGYLLVRYEDDGNYIDYLADFTTENVQDIVFGQNVIDMKMTDDASEFYTAILPLGAKLKEQQTDEEGNVSEVETNNRLTVEAFNDGLITDGVYKKGKYFYKPDLVQKYGWIVAPVSETTWDDVTLLNNLRINALAYFKGVDAFNGTIEVNAFDLHNTDSEISSFRVNKYVHCILAPHGIDVRTVLSGMEVDIADVQNTRITVGKTKRGLIDEQKMNFNSLKDHVENMPSTIKKDTEATVTYKLVNYYTKTETDAVVKDTKDEWSRTMTAKTEEVKQYAAQVASDAESNANSDTDDKLLNYSKTTEMQAYVQQTAAGIVSEATKDVTTKSDFNNLFSFELITNQDLSTWRKESNAIVELQDDGYYKVTSSTTTSYYGCFFDMLLDPGTYTFEMDVKAGSYVNCTVSASMCMFGGVGNSYKEDTHIKREIKATETNKFCRVYVFESAGSTSYAKNPSFKKVLTDDDFAEAQIQYNSRIQQTAEGLRSEVSQKVGNNEIISCINQSAETVSIQADKIDFNGAVSANGYFTIGTNGVVDIKAGAIEFTSAWDNSAFNCKTIIDSSGVYTEQVLNGLAFDFRGNLFNGLSIMPSGKSDLSTYNCLNLSRDFIGIVKGNVGNLAQSEYIKISKSSSPYSICAKLSYSVFSQMTAKEISTTGNLSVGGTKNRIVKTDHFGEVKQNALETPVPTFADYGEAKLDETGHIRIFLDEIFAETIDTTTIFNVFLTKYGKGDLWVADRQPDYFDVEGTPNLSFSWMINATQKDYNTTRLEEYQKYEDADDFMRNNEDENIEEFTNELEEWEGEF